MCSNVCHRYILNENTDIESYLDNFKHIVNCDVVNCSIIYLNGAVFLGNCNIIQGKWYGCPSY